jgi:O-antigen ligase
VAAAAPDLLKSRSDVFAWRPTAFVAACLLAWVTLKPFADLGSADALDLVTGRETLTYVCFAALAAFCLWLVAPTDRRALQSLATPSFCALAAWVALSCVTSQDIVTSSKRAAACAFVAAIAASLPLLPRGRLHLADLLAVSAGALLALSYFGVIFMPQYAIHQASDFVEPGLAGDWRGVFGHKNDASIIFALVAFIGIYVARAGRTAPGLLICALSLVFILFAQGKSAMALWLPTFAICAFVGRGGASRAWLLVALATLLALNMLGIGSVFFSPLASASAALPLDSTFTGRTELWRFAVGQLSSHPYLGYGFSAFWSTEAVRYGADDPSGWVAGAAHAHNGYLDAALTMGLPGLVLTLWAFVVQPLTDIRRAVRSSADPALVTLLTQIWLFGVLVSSFETFLFDRTNPIWFTFLFAVFGLRYLASFRTRAQ